MEEKELRRLIPIQAEWSIPQLQENLAVALEGSGPALSTSTLPVSEVEENIALVDEKHLSREQLVFVKEFFEQQVRGNVIPLMVESIAQMPYLRDKSIYLGIVMRKKNSAYKSKYALIEVPVSAVGRFVELPTKTGGHQIILLEDIIRINLPVIFSYFGYDHFESAIFKITKDAEIDIDNDLSSNLIEKIEKGKGNQPCCLPKRQN